jgi:hypothetical protein
MTKTIRKRTNAAGSVSWQVDMGMIEGKRVRKSFRTRREAEQWDRPSFKAYNASVADFERETARRQTLNDELETQRSLLEREIARLRSFRMQVGIPQDLIKRVPEGRMIFELPSASSGVYFLYLGDLLQYIGMSKDVPQRVARHRQNGFLTFDRVLVIPYVESELFEMESWWIKELCPPRNGVAPLQFQTQHCRP